MEKNPSVAGAPVYVTESGSHARQFANKHAAKHGLHATKGSHLRTTAEGIADLLQAYGSGCVVITWAPAVVPIYEKDAEEARGERHTTLYKVWVNY